MVPKHYTETATLRFRLVDVTLTLGVIGGLGELSGDDVEMLYELRSKLQETRPPADRFVPVQRTDESFQKEVDIVFKTTQVQFMLHMLYSRLKCFGAGDIDQVVEVRKRLKDALEAAEKKTDESETEGDDS